MSTTLSEHDLVDLVNRGRATHVHTDTQQPVSALADGVTREYLLHHRVCPDVIETSGAMVIAASPSAYLEAIPELGVAYGCRVTTREVEDGDVERMIERLTARGDSAVVDATSAGDITDGPTTVSLRQAVTTNARQNAVTATMQQWRGKCVQRKRVQRRCGSTVQFPVDGFR